MRNFATFPLLFRCANEASLHTACADSLSNCETCQETKVAKGHVTYSKQVAQALALSVASDCARVLNFLYFVCWPCVELISKSIMTD
jgi:hypothetical protein